MSVFNWALSLIKLAGSIIYIPAMLALIVLSFALPWFLTPFMWWGLWHWGCKVVDWLDDVSEENGNITVDDCQRE